MESKSTDEPGCVINLHNSCLTLSNIDGAHPIDISSSLSRSICIAVHLHGPEEAASGFWALSHAAEDVQINPNVDRELSPTGHPVCYCRSSFSRPFRGYPLSSIAQNRKLARVTFSAFRS
ncbi:hypothetical protein AVEN_144262-1 [Araneus ventricosus]|uniref:Uncharacterized protein n=1 Tax=Araneus ventricosus TaxID=182803 RepID=A0A4Y2V6K9_ARAVE|nr:hypothetical protein AVEN_121934-1 [Araneus ventricosus]GBO20026.1 hypothetical protein AVEN_175454-1 [Araneus ventricosus]GBO20923.1 hypothetical protein AVEN_148363-1 [Araneus ventricosus]GBO20945.1 hypothetical protein AVEN_144262-1 [Araneus ventricosus]